MEAIEIAPVSSEYIAVRILSVESLDKPSLVYYTSAALDKHSVHASSFGSWGPRHHDRLLVTYLSGESLVVIAQLGLLSSGQEGIHVQAIAAELVQYTASLHSAFQPEHPSVLSVRCLC